MKKLFDFKSILTKVALIMAIIILFEFVMSRPVKAETSSFGGTLLEPIVSFIAFLGDGAIAIIQSALLGQDNSYIYVDLSKENNKSINIFKLAIEGILGIGAVTAAKVLVSFTPLGPITWAVDLIALASGVTGTFAGKAIYENTPIGDILSAMLGESFVYASIAITPENILNNKMSFFNVDFFNKTKYSNDTENGNRQVQSAVESIRNVVSQVYVTVRDITLILIIIVAVVLVIKMLLESRPMEKKRISDLLVNCIKGLAIIIMMHYIMYILVTINNSIAGSINNVTEYSSEEEANQNLTNSEGKLTGQIFAYVEKGDNNLIYKRFKDIASNFESGSGQTDTTDKLWNVSCKEDDGEYTTTILANNFTEIARYRMQKVYDVDSNDEDNKTTSLDRISWGIVYILLVAITVVYVWLYAKRVIYIAVLTMLTPIVGLMYPLNRSEGGHAQALNYWFREYVATLTMQPFQCLLYSVLIGGAMQMALNNPIYVIVALISMITLERFIKSLIGMPESNIGGLGKALSETTKGINNMTRAANKVVGTAAKIGATGAIAGAGLINKGIDKAEELSEKAKEEDENGKIRTEENAGDLLVDGKDEKNQNKEKLNDPLQVYDPLQADIDAYTDREAELLKNGDKKIESGVTEENFDPEAMGLPPEMADEIREINGWSKPEDEGLDLYEGDEKNKNEELDEDATLNNYLAEGFGQNDEGEFFNPYTDEYDSNYNPLNDAAFRVDKNGNPLSLEDGKDKEGELDEEATLSNYLAEGFGQNDKGEFFNPYTDEYDPNYNPLNDVAFRVDKNGNPLPLEEKNKAKASENADLLENRINEEATLKKYQDAGFTKNIDGQYFNPYTDEFDASYNPLNDPAFRVEKQNIGDENVLNKGKAKASGGNVMEGKFLGTNGTMNAYSASNGNIRLERNNGPLANDSSIQLGDKKVKRSGRAQASKEPINIQRNDTPDGKEAMAMAMAANSGITHTTVGTGEVKSGKNSNTIEFSSNTMSAGGASVSSSKGGSSILGSVSGTTSIPDGRNRGERTNKAQPSSSSVNISEKQNSSLNSSSGTEISYIGNNSTISSSTAKTISNSVKGSISSNGSSDRKVEVQESKEPEITYTTNESTKIERSSPEITYSGDNSSSSSDYVASTFESILPSNSGSSVTRSTADETEISRPQTTSRRVNISSETREDSSNTTERTVEVERNRDAEVTYTSREPIGEDSNSIEITYQGDNSSPTTDFVSSTFGSILPNSSAGSVETSTVSESEVSRPQTTSRRINTSNAIRDNSSSNNGRRVEPQGNREITYTSDESSKTEKYNSGATITYTENSEGDEISYGGKATEKISDTTQKVIIENAKQAGIEIPEKKQRVQEKITSGAEKIADVFNTVAKVSDAAANVTERVTNTMEKTLSGDVVGATTYVVDSVSAGVNGVVGTQKTSEKKSNTANTTTSSGNNEVRVTERKETPQHKETVTYVQREVPNMNKEKINVVVNQCTKYKIKDKTNISFIAEMHHKSGRENPELTKMAALVIDAKRKGATLDEVKEMLGHSDKINEKERKLLANFYEKAKQ